MTRWTKAALAGLLLLAVAAAGCADGDPVAVGVAGSGVGCIDSLDLTLTSGGGSSGAVYNEAPSATAPGGCDPAVESAYDTTNVALNVNAMWVYNAALPGFENFLLMFLKGPQPSSPTSYALVSAPSTAGEASLTYYNTSVGNCVATGGTVTVGVYGPVGSPTEGTYDVTGFSGGAGCPDTASGGFSATREPDL